MHPINYINSDNLYKLGTHEDAYHIHKTLGVSSVIIYFYRLVLCFFYGSMFMQQRGGLITLGIHGCLSLTSFIFTLSEKRHSKLPIIYPEFRLHNTLFAFRSIICCLSFYYGFGELYNIIICYLTMIAADVISCYYKHQKNKDTQTMCYMPYMEHLDVDQKLKVISMHSFMQLVATYYMIENIDTAYSPIFAIQISSFLMTLVKKYIISTQSWHYLYSLALWLNIILLLSCKHSFFFRMNAACCFMYYWRVCRGMNKYIGWTIAFSIHFAFKRYVDWYVDNVFANMDAEYAMGMWYVLVTTVLLYFHRKFYYELL